MSKVGPRASSRLGPKPRLGTGSERARAEGVPVVSAGGIDNPSRGGLGVGSVPLVILWGVATSVWAMVESTSGLSTNARIFGLSMVLTGLGVVGLIATSRGIGVLTALAQLKLGPWMSVGFALGYGLATLVWLISNPDYHGLVTPASLPSSGVGLVAGVGFLAFLFAYKSTPGVIKGAMSDFDLRIRGNGEIRQGASPVWVLWSISTVAQVVGAARGSLGYLSDPTAALNASSSLGAVLASLTMLGVLATLLSAWRAAAQKTMGALVLLLFVSGTQLALGLFSGMKEAAIIHLVALVVGYSAKGRLRLTAVMGSALVVVFLITPFVTAYRQVILSGGGRLSPSQVLNQVDFTNLLGSGGSPTGQSTSSSQQAIQRWSRIGDLAMITSQTPSQIPYVSPDELLVGPIIGFIPRSVWPQKPVLDAGYQVNMTYYRASADTYSSAAVTPYGDLYRHGGLWVVIVGMVLLGFFVRAVDSRVQGSIGGNPSLLFLPMLLFTIVVKQEIDYLGLCASLVSTIAAAALAVRLVTRGSSPVTRRAVSKSSQVRLSQTKSSSMR